jgi:hypothetical protein
MQNKRDKELFSLLVRVYNNSIQCYFHFPDVIIYGNHRLERQEFEQLLSGNYIAPCYADSFGKIFRLTKKAEILLHLQRNKKKRRPAYTLTASALQCRFDFV